MAKGQGIELEFDESLVEHLAEVGYKPEFGARELRRKIQSEVENPLAEALLSGELSRGDHVLVRYEAKEGRVLFDKKLAPAPTGSNGHNA